MASPSVTYTFTNGTVADADEINTNFADLISSMTDASKDFSISALTCAGAATFNGNVTVGNASSDDFTITASLSSSVPIKTTATYNFGSSTLGLLSAYFGGNSQTTRVMGSGSMSATWTFTLPPATGTKGEALYDTDGSGTLGWAPLQTDMHAVSSANYSITDTDGYGSILVTTAASTRTITLPTVADNTDRTIMVKKVDSGAGTVAVDGEGAETIDGRTIWYLPVQYNHVTVRSDGTSWHIVDERISGTYSPSISNKTNCSAEAVRTHKYSQNGRVITVFGNTRFTITTDATDTSFDISLPISTTNFTSFDECFGTCVVQKDSGDVQDVGWIIATSSAQTVSLSVQALASGGSGVTSVEFSYSFSYELI